MQREDSRGSYCCAATDGTFLRDEPKLMQKNGGGVFASEETQVIL